jgi:hypothetical protein
MNEIVVQSNGVLNIISQNPTMDLDKMSHYKVYLSYSDWNRKFDFDVFKETKEVAIQYIKEISDKYWGHLHGDKIITAEKIND